MQAKPRARVYGKKSRQQDNLDEAFANLNLESAKSASLKEEQTNEVLVRVPLRANSSNSSLQPYSDGKDVKCAEVLGRRTHQKTQSLRLDSRRKYIDSRNEISALTSLAHVKDEIFDFEQACRLWVNNYTITKIAHGSYAAIFRLQLCSDKSKYIIAKLIPLKPKSGKGSQAADQTSIEDAVTEVKALDTMSEVPGFVGFSEAWVLRGPLPALFLEQYENWARSHPDDGFAEYRKGQLWCFIEMSDAGTDLERILQNEPSIDDVCGEVSVGKSLRLTHCWDIFWGIAEALGRGEEFSEFEHRDLHPGNVCVIKDNAVMRSSIKPSLRTKYTNLQVTLIDYTLSRATLLNGEVLANPMRDKSIFEQRIENPCTQQQCNDNRQYALYRRMRQHVMELSESEDEDQAWQTFVPQTNLFWLHHILSILICSADTPDEASVGDKVPKARVKKNNPGVKQVQHTFTARESPLLKREAAIGQLLVQLRDILDPDQSNGCKWSSVKALLESELYWTNEF